VCANKVQQNQVLYFSPNFYSDMSDDGMLYAVLLRSPYAKAHNFSFDIPDLPEGYSIYRAKDIPGKNEVVIHDVKCEVFCSSDVLYKGQVIGILTGPDKQKLELLRTQMTFNFEGAASVDSDEAEIQIFEKNYQTKDFNPEVFNSVPNDIHSEWKCNLDETLVTESEGAFISYKNGEINVFSHAPWISHLRETVENVTGLEDNKVLITRTNSNTLNTNSLWLNSILCAQLCVAVIKNQKSVKLVLSRTEQKQFVEQSLPVLIEHRTAVDEDGRIKACDILVRVNVGAFNPLAEEILERLVIASCGMYSPENMRVKAVALSSGESPASTSWERVDATAFYAMECQIHKICEITGLSPVEIREKNLEQGKKSSLPFKFNYGKINDVIQAVSKKSDFLRKWTAYRLDEKDRYVRENASPFNPPLRGIGIACAFEGSTYFGSRFIDKDESLEVSYSSNKELNIKFIPTSSSIGKIWKKIACQKLGLSDDELSVNWVFDESVEFDLPDTISADISLNTQLFIECIDEIKSQIETGKHNCSARKTFKDSIKSNWVTSRFSGTPFYSTSSASCVVELELDPCSYQEIIRGIFVCIDAGRIMSSVSAERAVKKAIRNVLANIVVNETIKCENINVMFVNSEEEPKQLGEIMYSVVPAAFACALSQSLAYSVTRLPIGTDTIYKISSKARRIYNERLQLEKLSQVSDVEELEEEEKNPELGDIS